MSSAASTIISTVTSEPATYDILGEIDPTRLVRDIQQYRTNEASPVGNVASFWSAHGLVLMNGDWESNCEEPPHSEIIFYENANEFDQRDFELAA